MLKHRAWDAKQYVQENRFNLCACICVCSSTFVIAGVSLCVGG